jgi:AcrR family transcriptional regulator
MTEQRRPRSRKPKTEPETKPPEPPVDARVRRSKELVLRTTFELLVERGMSHVSVDEVSSRSGVAKTTIYRHWRTRTDLVFEACALVSASMQPPDTGSFEGDVTQLLLGLAHQLRTAAWPHVLPSVVDTSERDPEFAEAFAQRQRNQSAAFATAIQRAQERGELAAKADVRTLVARLVGPLFYRRWFTREPLDEAFVRDIISSVVGRE